MISPSRFGEGYFLKVFQVAQIIVNGEPTRLNKFPRIKINGPSSKMTVLISRKQAIFILHHTTTYYRFHGLNQDLRKHSLLCAKPCRDMPCSMFIRKKQQFLTETCTKKTPRVGVVARLAFMPGTTRGHCDRTDITRHSMRRGGPELWSSVGFIWSKYSDLRRPGPPKGSV